MTLYIATSWYTCFTGFSPGPFKVEREHSLSCSNGHPWLCGCCNWRMDKSRRDRDPEPVCMYACVCVVLSVCVCVWGGGGYACE